ncbi:MAG: hypothetical protein ACE5EO_10545 [Candidatus Krumholzibacteriia bacterium]
MPAGLDADVNVVGTADSFHVTSSTTLDSLTPGTYDISALDVVDPVLPVIWEPMLSASQLTVTASNTSSVTAAYDSVRTLIHTELRTADGFNGVYAKGDYGILDQPEDRPEFNGAPFVANPCGSGWSGGFSIAKDVGQVHAELDGAFADVNFRAALPDIRTIRISWTATSDPVFQGKTGYLTSGFSELPYPHFYGDVFNPQGDSLRVTIEWSAVLHGTPNPVSSQYAARSAATSTVAAWDCNTLVFGQELFRMSTQGAQPDTLTDAGTVSFGTRSTQILLRINLSASATGRVQHLDGISLHADASGWVKISVNEVAP